jgi:GntR family transcriptional regulator
MRPRYQEIAEYLRELVVERDPGDLLPSEAELCKRFGVSRMTARHAVEILEREHLVYRRRGKGTFVGHRPVPRLLGSPLSFSESMRRRDMVPSSTVIASGFADPSPEDVVALAIDGRGPVGVLERIRHADGIPMAIERAVLAPDVAAVIETIDDGSLHDAFRAMGRSPHRAAAQVDARKATEEEQRLLDLGPDGVVLCERRVIYDGEGTPLEHTETRYAAGRYLFDVMMYGQEP